MDTPPNQQHLTNADEIDLLSLFDAIFERKWFVLSFTLVCAILSFCYAASRVQAPTYKAVAVVHLGAHNPRPNLGSLGGIDAIIDATPASATYIEYMSSRTLIGEVVDRLNLTITIAPKLFPIFGVRAQNLFTPMHDQDLAAPLFGATNYAWGGEKIKVSLFNTPANKSDTSFKIIAGPNHTFSLYHFNDTFIISGKIGTKVTRGEYQLRVDELVARNGTEFNIINVNRYRAISALQQQINITPKGKGDTGVISLSYSNPSPARAEEILNTLINTFISHTIARNSMDVKNSLEFLQTQLPLIQHNLQESETRFNDYQKVKSTVDINYESKNLLSTLASLNKRAIELQDRHLELSHKYKRAHPKIQGVLEKLASIKAQKRSLQAQLNNLPETQRNLAQLTRKVEVGKETYMQLLSKTQELELEIVRAGTARNVHIIDAAEADKSPVSHQKTYLATVLGTLLGLVFSLSIIIINKLKSNGIEDAADIEMIGLPVYASIPFCEQQIRLSKKSKNHLLSVSHPNDFVVEYLRGLRTSLHFAMTDAQSNIISITGSAPGVGKSFISSNLTAVIAQSGSRTLLIDGDMRKGSLHQIFNASSKQGLSNILAGTLKLNEAICSTDIDNLDIIPRGSIPPNPAELLMSPRFQELLDELTKSYDFILIDTPPILSVTDPAIIAKCTSATLMVTKFRETSLAELQYTRNKFKQNGIEIKGVVFNSVPKDSRHHFYTY